MKGMIENIGRRALVIGLALVVGGQIAFSQGTVSMTNLSQGRVDAPVSGPNGERLSGSRYKVQLIAGSTADSLSPVGDPISFERGAIAGYFFGPVLEIETVSPGATAFAAIRAWDTRNGGATYDRSSVKGVSNVIEVQTGGAIPGRPPALPGSLAGLKPFMISSSAPPSIGRQPESVVTSAGSDIALSFEVSGSSPMEISWTRDGVEIPGATTNILRLSEVGPEDEGVYVATAKNAFGSDSSRGAIVVVNEDGGTVIFSNFFSDIFAPVFDVDGETKLSGDAFRAQLFAGPNARNLGSIGPAIPFQSGALAGIWRQDPTSTRVIPTVRAGDQAIVQVRVWETDKGATFEEASSNGSKVGVSETLTLVTGGAGAPPSLPVAMTGLESFQLVEDRAPRIDEDLAGTVVDLGAPLSLSVGVVGSEPLVYAWEKDGVLLKGFGGPTLNIPETEASDAGMYSVSVSNAQGSAQSSTALVFVRESGGQVVFSNLGFGVDAPVLDTDGTPLAGDGFRVAMFAGPTESLLMPVGPGIPFQTGPLAGYWSNLPTNVRHIPTVSAGGIAFVQARAWVATDGATYADALAANGRVGRSNIVRVQTGGAGSPPSLPATLEGLESFQLSDVTLPIINEAPQDALRLSGMSMEWTVGVTAVGEMSYQWQIAKGNGGFRDITDGTSNTLSLTDLTPGDSGRYRVLVSNRAGTTTSAEAALRVIPPQPLLGGLNRNGDFALSLGAVVEDLGDSFEEAIVEVQATSPEFDGWETIGEFPIGDKGKVEFVDKDASKHSSRIYRFVLKR